MKLELKRPQIIVEKMSYGDYLMKNPNMVPREGVPLETNGYLVTGTQYGTSTDTTLPFKAGDWIDEDYVKSNFNKI